MTAPATAQSTDRLLAMGDATPAPDTHSWELIDRARDGDREAFAELYERYVDVVFRYAMHRVDGDRQLAEDITSETFTRALRRIDTYVDHRSDVGAWFVTIARNLILDHYKSKAHSTSVLVPDFASFSRMLPFRRTGPGMATRIANQSAYTQLWACVAQLRTDQRECVIMRFLGGMSVSQVAKVMGRNDGAIKALQHRAVRRLAQLIPAELADCLRGD